MSMTERKPIHVPHRRGTLLCQSVPSTTPTTTSSIFDRLPLEIHAEIFSCCLQPFLQLGWGWDPDSMVITRVCRTWRALTHSTPRLWSSLAVDVKYIDNESDCRTFVKRTTNRVALWLERSKNQPISFRLVHNTLARNPNRVSGDLLALILARSKRVLEMEVTIPTVNLPTPGELETLEFRILRSVTLRTMSPGAPHQRRIDPGSLGFFHGFKLPWNQLTELDLRLDHIHILNLDDYAKLLSNNRSLRVCRIDADYTPTPMGVESEHPEALVLPSLRILHVALQGPGVPSQIPLGGAQPRFHTPEESLVSFLSLFSGCSGLEGLHIQWLVDGREGVEHWAPVHPGFLSLLDNLSPSLRTLELAYLPLNEDQLVESLALLPTLEVLHLQFSVADHLHDPVTDRVLDALTLPKHPGQSSLPRVASSLSPRPALMRNLRRIRIQCTGVHCSEETILNLLNSRVPPPSRYSRSLIRPPGTGLQDFHFSFMDCVVYVDVASGIEPTDLQRLDSYFI